MSYLLGRFRKTRHDRGTQMIGITVPGRTVVMILLVAAATSATILPAMAGRGEGPQAPGRDSSTRARNVILLIGDGMGDFELSAARYYEYGGAGRLNVDDMPTRSAVTTYSVTEAAPHGPDYVPDSASTATAWSTGTKTSDGRISTTAGTDEDLTTVMDLAEQADILTGNVSTARLTDATPAAPMAKVALRRCEGPTQTTASCPQDATQNGGPGSIAEQSIHGGLDLLLGGGADRYDQTIEGGRDAGQTVAEAAQAAGYMVVRTAADLAAVERLPVLGLFSGGHLPTEGTGPQAAPGGVGAECVPNPDFTSEVPTIDEMTATALELLDRTRGGEGRADGQPGFLLQVEGASIDKRDHASEACQQIGETVAFDRAVGVALDYARRSGNTLVIVSADHTHTSQIIPAGDTDSPGATATLTTADGEPLKINYATSPVAGSQDHTGATVPYFAFGPGSDGVGSLIDQTDIFGIVADALGLR